MRNKVISTLLSLIMCISILAAPVYAQELPDASVEGMITRALEWKRGGKSIVMDDAFLSGVSSTATDWDALALGRLGVEDNYSGFLSAAASYVSEKYAEDPIYGLSINTATEWHRLTVALLAAGGNPLSVGGQNLIRDGAYDCLIGAPWRQGTNGAIWALISLDSFGYEVPDGAAYGRADLIRYLLDNEKNGGGWSLSARIPKPDADITAMAVQALAPYYTGDPEVKDAVDRGLEFLKSCQKEEGDVSSTRGGKGSSEATCQTIIAFCCMGQDPDKIVSSSGKSLIDGLRKYENAAEGGFYHDVDLADKGSDGMATQQALYTLAGYQRYLQGETNLYDFRADAKEEQYCIKADGRTYLLDAGNGKLELPDETKEIVIENLPIGNYDSAVIDADGQTFQSSYRRADGSTPVDGNISIDGEILLAIHVTELSGETKTWELKVTADGEIDDETAARYVEEQIAALPETENLTLDDELTVADAREAYDGLTEIQKALVKNVQKLTEAEKKIAELKIMDRAQLEAEREALKKNIEEIAAPVKISQKKTIQRYLRELDELGEWNGKDALKDTLDGYMREIIAREKVIEQLDTKIWNQIKPLDISQKDAENVKTLMQVYSLLSDEERSLLKNEQSLLEAADVVESLEDGIIPAKVFENMMSTKNDFTYYGVDVSGKDYTLTYDADSVKKAEAINAKAEIIKGSKGIEDVLASVDFHQHGSMNGKVTFVCDLGIAEGTHRLYWLDTESLSMKNAGKASVDGGELTMSISRGGNYRIADGVISLETGKDEKTKAKTDKKTTMTKKTNEVKATVKEGLVGKSQFTKVKGKDENLRISGTYGDKKSYTFTFYGKDIKEAVDFQSKIQAKCGHSKEISQLAEDPFLLCMEKTGPFPGKALLSMETGMEDGTYLLFTYDAEEMKAEYVKKLEISKGKAEFTLSEGGDYFIARRAKSASLKEETEEKADITGTGNNDIQTAAVNAEVLPLNLMIFSMIFGAVIMAAGISVGYLIGRNKNSPKREKRHEKNKEN